MLQIFQLSPLSLKSWGLFVFIAAILTSCAAPPPTPNGGLNLALLEDTGYGLGSKGSNSAQTGQGSCAVESRYGYSTNGAVSQLVCVSREGQDGDRVKYRISYTKPSAGHRIWKIAATYPDKKVGDLNLVEKLEAKYGTPRKVSNPLALTWQKESAYLELREDQYGVHLQLWDRGLR